nr:alpha/beta fold hydrolase [Micromonospora sp. DSM 115978]
GSGSGPEVGADVPTVVLAHGWTCSIDFWTPQVRALADRCHVVAYDQRGHGRSWNGTTTGFTLDALADDLRAVIEATVPPGRRAVLVGHSMGAMATIAFARRHHDLLADRVAAVVLASTGVRELTPTAAFLGLPRLLDPL